jgi:hypothetical protein
MSAPTEHKTIQARILHYAQEIGWTCVPRAEAERRRGFDADGATPEERARKASLFFGDLLHELMTAQLRVYDIHFSDLGVDCKTREREAVAPNR